MTEPSSISPIPLQKEHAEAIQGSQGNKKLRINLGIDKESPLYKVAVSFFAPTDIIGKLLLKTKMWGTIKVNDKTYLVNINSVSKRLGISKKELRDAKDITALVDQRKSELIGEELRRHNQLLREGFTSKEIRVIKQIASSNLVNRHYSQGEKLMIAEKKIVVPLSLKKTEEGIYIHHKKLGVGATKTAKLVIGWENLNKFARLVPNKEMWSNINAIKLTEEAKILEELHRDGELENVVKLVKATDIKSGKNGFMLEYFPLNLTKISQDDNIPLKHKVMMMKMAVNGLINIHEKGIAHRDFKPDNILCDYNPENPENSHVAIADFDLSGKVSEELPSNNIGTYGYAPPEMGQSKMWSERMDVYSLGVAIKEVCFGIGPVLSIFEADQCNIQGSDGTTYELSAGKALPENLPEPIRKLIKLSQDAKSLDPKDRPTLQYIHLRLDEIERNLDEGLTTHSQRF